MVARIWGSFGARLWVLLLVALSADGWGAKYYVAQNAAGASDQNAGTAAAPMRSLSAAMAVATPGDSIEVADGVYREAVAWPGDDWENPNVRLTLAAAPRARPVIKGSEVVPGPWRRADVALTAPTGQPPAIYSAAWEPYSTMVFVDEAPLKQIGLQGSPVRAEKATNFKYQKQWDGRGAEDMRPGSFFYDATARRLYVWLADGGDPAAHVIEASVRDVGLSLRGTWTVRGLDVRHVQDGLWPNEQAAAIAGNGCAVEDCRITHNDFLGLIVSGEDCVIRNCEIGYNGLCGMTSNLGYRMVVEGNEFHHNGWRGDVVCLTYGNKWVQWRESRFLRNRFHDEPATALWFDINVNNVLVAENTFENCNVGVYFEISRWGVIVDNVFKGCGRAIWVYGSDCLVAHNVIDGCGEGITVSGYPRTATYPQSVVENATADCLMAVRNNLVVDNILIDCPGSFIGVTEPTPYGWGNWSDYNAFVWTLAPYHRTGAHINFLNGWNSLYATLPIWRMERHQDTHSVVVDPGLLEDVRSGSPWVQLAESELLPEAGFVDRVGGDYRLRDDSPLRGRGVALPLELSAHYAAGPDREVVSRAWAPTRLVDAPDPTSAKPVYGTPEDGHYRLQPLPPTRSILTIDPSSPGTPGLNLQWRESGEYPHFAPGPPESAEPTDWVLYPENLVSDPSFAKPLAEPAARAEERVWVGGGGMHTYVGMLCANLMAGQRENVPAFQRVGTIAAGCEYLLHADLTVASRMPDMAGVAMLYLAAGDPSHPIGTPVVIRVGPGKAVEWSSYDTQVRTGATGDDPNVGQDLLVVVAGRVEGPQDAQSPDAVVLLRCDDVWLLSGQPRG